MLKKLVILGAGGYAYTVKDIAEQLNYEVVAMLDDKLSGYELNTFINYLSNDVQFIVAFGNNGLRLSWTKKIEEANGQIATLIHPSSYVSPKAVIGKGTVVLPKACVNTDAVVRECCIVNLGAIIDHGCIIEEGCHICLGAIIKGENHVKACTKVEAGTVVERATMK